MHVKVICYKNTALIFSRQTSPEITGNTVLQFFRECLAEGTLNVQDVVHSTVPTYLLPVSAVCVDGS